MATRRSFLRLLGAAPVMAAVPALAVSNTSVPHSRSRSMTIGEMVAMSDEDFERIAPQLQSIIYFEVARRREKSHG